jgi:nitrogen fixation protein NifZ
MTIPIASAPPRAGIGYDCSRQQQRRTTMGLAREQAVEINAAPLFSPGEKVRSIKHIKNDGTYPGKEIGENLVRKGDVGYVRDIGTYLQQFYIYAIEFADRAVIVGMRGKELASVDNPPAKAKQPIAMQEPAP